MSDSVPEAGAPQRVVAPEPGFPTEPGLSAGAGLQAEAETEAEPKPKPEYESEPEPEYQSEPEPEPEYDPAAPAPLDVPRTTTGNADVDAALDRLADADHLATDGHVEVYEDVHQGLRDALTALDARPGPPAPPSTYDRRS